MTRSALPDRIGLLTLTVVAVLVAMILAGHRLASAAPEASGIAVQPTSAAQQGAPGTEITYTLRVTNTADDQDTIQIGISGYHWPTNMLVNGSATGLLPLLGHTGQDVQIVVSIPLTATGSAVALFSAISQDDPTISVTVPLTTTVQMQAYLPLIRR